MTDDAFINEDDIFAHEPEEYADYGETVAFFGHIAYLAPPLRDVLADHLREADGEMLPNLLMGDVTRWVLATFGPGGGDVAAAREVLQVLEDGYIDGSDGIRAVIVMSFLEALPGFNGKLDDTDGRGAVIRAALGPTLGRGLARLEQWRREGGLPRG